ncbi:MAG: hypothetical protein EBT95_00210 [Verrucomicrobia bacterium]|nr:hypothetical protein [Verrucomicrobiota bacterium]
MELVLMTKAQIKISQFMSQREKRHMSFQIPEKDGLTRSSSSSTLTSDQIRRLHYLITKKSALRELQLKHSEEQQQDTNH